MAGVKIFTNSCSDIPPSLAEELGIALIPDTIIFNGVNEYRNNIDITPKEIFPMMDQSPKLPTTSHPNIAVYESCFKTAENYDDILCITITSKMSGTHNTAKMASDMLKAEGFKPNIYVYDSLQVSFGLAIMAVRAAALAKEGKSVSEIISFLDSIKSNVGVYFIMKSLQNAKKGGRVGAVKVLAADTLGVNHLLMFRDGLVKDIGIMRNYTEGLNAVIEKYKKLAAFGGEVFIFHSDNENDARFVEYKIREIDPNASIRIEWVGAAIGIYTGRGCVGISFIEK